MNLFLTSSYLPTCKVLYIFIVIIASLLLTSIFDIQILFGFKIQTYMSGNSVADCTVSETSREQILKSLKYRPRVSRDSSAPAHLRLQKTLTDDYFEANSIVEIIFSAFEEMQNTGLVE